MYAAALIIAAMLMAMTYAIVRYVCAAKLALARQRTELERALNTGRYMTKETMRLKLRLAELERGSGPGSEQKPETETETETETKEESA